MKTALVCLAAGAGITGLLGAVHAMLEDPLTSALLTPLTAMRDLAPATADGSAAGWSVFPFLVLGSAVSTLVYAALVAALLLARSRLRSLPKQS